MAGSVNKVILVGNLGADPELRQTSSGKSVAELRLATTSRYADKDGNFQESTEWHRVIVWGDQGENCAKFLSKGRSCYVEGRLQTRSWEDKDGNKKYTTEVIAHDVQFLGSKGESSEGVGDDTDDDDGGRRESPSSKGKRGKRPSGRGKRTTEPTPEMPTDTSWDDEDE